jgi:hypothetical protein
MSGINVTVSNKPGISVKTPKKSSILVNQSGFVVRTLNDLVDVDTSAKEDGSLLIYDVNQDKFVSSRLLEKQNINGGHF